MTEKTEADKSDADNREEQTLSRRQRATVRKSARAILHATERPPQSEVIAQRMRR